VSLPAAFCPRWMLGVTAGQGPRPGNLNHPLSNTIFIPSARRPRYKHRCIGRSPGCDSRAKKQVVCVRLELLTSPTACHRDRPTALVWLVLSAVVAATRQKPSALNRLGLDAPRPWMAGIAPQGPSWVAGCRAWREPCLCFVVCPGLFHRGLLPSPLSPIAVPSLCWTCLRP
jgi:hypothetical protein